MIYADIIIDLSLEKLDRSFQYAVPPSLKDRVFPGCQVLVPFGKGDRKVRGYVISLSETPAIDIEKIRPILEVIETGGKPGGEEQLLKLSIWIKNHYGGTLSQALKVVFPIRKSVGRRVRRTVIPLLSPDELNAAADQFSLKHNAARERTLRALACSGEIEESLLKGKLNIDSSVLKGLEERGFLRLETVEGYRNPKISGDENRERHVLSGDQEEVLKAFKKDLELKLNETYLIRGITGSGKTLIYIEMIEEVVKSGRQAIMLIPEIALTFQTVMRFHARFGNRVSYMHSRLSPGERFDQFERARNGEIDVMIGPRSALFTPFNDLGIIIIDEEHESSYKSETVPKYHTRETAAKRAEIAGASFVLGSATPSLEARYMAERGESRLFTLDSRPTGGTLPNVSVVDMRDELKNGNRTMFSGKLLSLMEDRLRKNEQIMLFLNRRGYSGTISCRKCGKAIKCPHCDVTLTSHNNGFLICHYCGYKIREVKECPSCGSKYLGGFRAGTEKIEEGVKKIFPEARILRMDADTTKKKEDYQTILTGFKEHKADILIGTQMIVKGHDFPLVTLVGIVLADLSLNASDYRAAERTFDLLTQAAGRAGRGDRPGEVVIQTYVPEHYSIEAAACQDYNMFYSREIGYRSLMSYPPVSHMLKVLIEGKNGEKAGKEAEDLVKEVSSFNEERKTEGKGFFILGPAPDAISKIKDVYRFVFFVKDSDYETLCDVRERLEKYRRKMGKYDNIVSYDFDG